MTLFAKWGGAQITSAGVGAGAGIRTSIGGYAAIANPNSPPAGGVQTAIISYARGTGDYVFEFHVGSAGDDSFQFGVIFGEPGASTGTGTVNSLQVNQNGVVLFNGAYLFTLTFTSSVMFRASSQGKLWMTPDATGNWFDGTGTYTLAQVEAGTGGLNLSAMPAGISPVANFYNGPWQGVIHLNSGQDAFIATAPAGVGYLPASLWGAAEPAEPGGTVYMPWTNPQSLAGTLEYSLDAATWLSCGGGNSGTSGTATAGTATSTLGLARYYYFRDSGNHTSQTPPQTVFVIPKPSGAGSLLAYGAGSVEGAPVPSWPVAWAGGALEGIYIASALAGGNYSNATKLIIYDAAGNQTGGIAFDNTFSSRNNLEPQYCPSGSSGTALAYAADGTTALATQAFDATTLSAGIAYGTAVLDDLVNSATGTLGPNVWPPGTLATPRFAYGAFLDTNTFGASTYGQDLAFAIWAFLSPETITITSASAMLGGTITFAGTTASGSSTAMNASVDSAGFLATGAFAPTGDNFIGSTTQTISTAGTHTLQLQDATNTYVESAPFDFVVSSAETLILASATVGAGGILLLGFTFTNGPPESLNLSLDDGGSYPLEVSGYTPPGSSSGVGTGYGPALAPGNYSVGLQDAIQTTVFSNFLPVNYSGSGGGTGLPTGGYLGSIPGWIANDFFAMCLKLMPRGRAWPTWVQAVQNQVLLALMPTFVRTAAAAAAILEDMFPGTTVYLLPQWQASLGLPDLCTPLGSTIAQQQGAVLEKFTRGGGQSKPYFENVAQLLGYEITIVENDPATRSWTIHAPFIAPPVPFRAGKSRSGDSLLLIQGNDQLECVFNQIKPSDTVLYFSYP